MYFTYNIRMVCSGETHAHGVYIQSAELHACRLIIILNTRIIIILLFILYIFVKHVLPRVENVTFMR